MEVRRRHRLKSWSLLSALFAHMVGDLSGAVGYLFHGAEHVDEHEAGFGGALAFAQALGMVVAQFVLALADTQGKVGEYIRRRFTKPSRFET